MFCIVEFTKEHEVAVVPDNWIKENTTLWPPYKESNKLTKAIIEKQPPQSEWAVHSSRILFTASTYQQAQDKLEKAEETSDLAGMSDKENTKKTRAKRKRKVPSDEESSDDDQQLKQKKKSYPTPKAPVFPVTKKNVYSSQSLQNESTASLRSPLVEQNHSKKRSHTSFQNGPLVEKNLSMKTFQTTPLSSLRNDNSRCSPSTSDSLDMLDFPIDRDNTRLTLSNVFSLIKKVVTLVEENRRQTRFNTSLLNQLLMGSNGDSSSLTDIAEEMPEFPMKTMDEFNEVEVLLTNRDIKIKLISALGCLGGNDVKKTTSRILQAMMKRSLSMQFNWAGRGEKRAFKDTIQKEVVVASVRRNALTRTATDDAIASVVKSWLRFSKDREGWRSKRQLTSQENVPSETDEETF